MILRHSIIVILVFAAVENQAASCGLPFCEEILPGMQASKLDFFWKFFSKSLPSPIREISSAIYSV
jgi:hypothetical protein